MQTPRTSPASWPPEEGRSLAVTPRILAEEESWTWLYKPPGLPVFPPHQDPDGPSLQRWLLQQCPSQDRDFPAGFSAGLAHRLDTSTSGVVLAARRPEDLALARSAFSEGRLKKTYRFLTAKRVPWSAHEVETPIAHHPRRRDRMVVQRGRNTPHRGRWYPATTTLRHIDGPLWEATMRTGVMHQIRVHAAWVGLALHGDHRYGGGHEPPPGTPPRVDFALHHVGLAGPELTSPRAPPPPWWPI